MIPLREWRWTHWVLLIGIFIIVILAATLIYVISQPDAFTPSPTPSEEQPPLTGLPPLEEGPPTFPPSPVEQIPFSEIQGRDTEQQPALLARGGITQVFDLTANPVEHIGLGPSGAGLNYYDPDENRFIRLDGQGQRIMISDRVFADVQDVTYAPNGNDAVIEFPDGSNIVYTIDNDEQVTLPAHWEDFAFSPASDSLAFKNIALDTDQNWLAVADKSGSGARQIAHLGEFDEILKVDWSPNNQVVGTYSRPDGLTQSELYFVGFNQENFPYSQLHGLNFEGTWTPAGDGLLYSVTHQDDDFKPRLWLVDGSGANLGQNRRAINLQTWSYKCTFSDNATAYCGVPETLPEGAGIIPAVADDIPDQIYRVDLNNGSVSRIAIPSENIHVEQLEVAEDDSRLYIHDGFTGRIKELLL